VASIKEEIRSRQAALVDVARAFHDANTTIEACRRFLLRVAARKRYLPDVADIERVASWAVQLAERDTAVQQSVERAQDVFRF